MISVALVTIAAAAVPALPAEPIRLDRKGRPMIAVQVDGKGPFDMLVDTAAQSSVMGEELAAALGLKPLDGQTVVAGVSGRMAANVYPLKRMSSAVFDLRDIEIVAVPRIGVTEAKAIVGIDIFADRRLVFDWAGKRLTTEPSGAPRAGFVVQKGTIGNNGLLTVPVKIDGVTIDALVDTGAEGSIANVAALRALGWRDDDPRLRAYGAITGATRGGTAARRGTVAAFAVGPVIFRDVPLVFAGGAATDAPRIILGMDMLGLLQAFAVDMPRGELHVFVPRRPAAG